MTPFRSERQQKWFLRMCMPRRDFDAAEMFGEVAIHGDFFAGRLAGAAPMLISFSCARPR